MGHLKFTKDIFYPGADVVGQLIPNHEKQVTTIAGQNQSNDEGQALQYDILTFAFLSARAHAAPQHDGSLDIQHSLFTRNHNGNEL
jgi:hypothetical protein